MELSDAIFGRRATRQYTEQSVDEATLQRLIAAAVHAPSAVNQQPWAFTVVRDQGTLDLISKNAKSHMIATVPAAAASDHVQAPIIVGHPRAVTAPVSRNEPVVRWVG